MNPIDALEAALAKQRAYRDSYTPASEPVLFELARAADDYLMRDPLGMMPKNRIDRMALAIREHGINDALTRMLPAELADGQFRLFPSLLVNSQQCDDFLFACGSIRLGEKMLVWLREGLITGEYREHDGDNGPLRVLILRTTDPSLGDEIVNRFWLRWDSDMRVRAARNREVKLMAAYRKIEAQLERSCHLVQGLYPSYHEAYRFINLFEEMGAYYLDRMFGRDMFGPSEMIGGAPFKDYLGAIRLLSGMQHLHLAALMILRRRHPDVEFRNLLAFPVAVEFTHELVARSLGCSTGHAERLLEPLTLSPANAERHRRTGEPMWPALIRASRHTYIHPLFGMDVNPHLFLLANLRGDHRNDWDSHTDSREDRWQTELAELLKDSRYTAICSDGCMLRENKRDLTDIDFAAYDPLSGDLLLIQLKWQHPFDGDDKVRRSMASNLAAGGNKWTATVLDWIDANGANELLRRLGFKAGARPRPRLFVLARYGAQFSGRSGHDMRSAWTSWPHFKKAWRHAGRKSAQDLARFIQRDAAEVKKQSKGIAATFTIGELGVLLNPTRVPPRQ